MSLKNNSLNLFFKVSSFYFKYINKKLYQINIYYLIITIKQQVTGQNWFPTYKIGSQPTKLVPNLQNC